MSRYQYTRIQFPRFQTEHNLELPIHRRRVSELPACPWVGAETARAVDGLAFGPTDKTIDLKRVNNWWGSYHHASVRYLPEVPVIRSEDSSLTYISGIAIGHAYEWDQQGLPGRAVELVVSTYDFETRRFTDAAALLIRKNPSVQQLALFREGSWQDPPSPETHDPERDFMLKAIGRLAATDMGQATDVRNIVAATRG